MSKQLRVLVTCGIPSCQSETVERIPPTLHVNEEDISERPSLQESKLTLLLKKLRAASGRQVQRITEGRRLP